MPEHRDKIYLDILRLIAIYCVVLNHTCGTFFLPAAQSGEVLYWWMLVQNQVVKMAVPLFLMTTGALLLHRDESLSRLLTHRVLRFLGVILFIGLLQYALHLYWGREPGGIWELCYMFHKNLGEYHEFWASWFLCAYLGILLLLPFLRMLARAMTRESFLYMLGVQVVFCCVLPVCGLLAGQYIGHNQFSFWLPFHPQTGTLPFSAGYCAFYVLVGYALEHRVAPEAWQKCRRPAVVLAILCLAAGAVSMELGRIFRGSSIIDQATVFLTAFLPIPCMVAYMSLKSACTGVVFKPQTRRIIATLGGGVLSVMLFENLFRAAWAEYCQQLQERVGDYAAGLLFAAVICVAAFLVGLLLKKLPVFRRIL